VRRIGIPDQFVEHGAPALLREKYGLDENGIFAAAGSLLETDAHRVPFPTIVRARQAQRG
jgi:deoxyxylulose-5-phosphate synthase